MAISLYQIDTFSDTCLNGSPAAVCVLDKPLEHQLMQSMAKEHAQSETAFIWEERQQLHIRWFTPSTEIELSDHSTLASAHVLFNERAHTDNTSLCFQSKSGPLICKKSHDGISLELPSIQLHPRCHLAPELIQGLGFSPRAIYFSKQDIVIELESTQQLLRAQPNLALWADLPLRDITLTAKGDDCDFISRSYHLDNVSKVDSVCGNTYSLLVPFWSNELNKTKLSTRRFSPKNNLVQCQLVNKRVIITGHAKTYMKGEIALSP